MTVAAGRPHVPTADNQLVVDLDAILLTAQNRAAAKAVLASNRSRSA
ncbi:hypothetical protein FRAHR75_1060011 [Frankia sp. Hr75.2]|nr:hypothetical protein FRAHR75_1060011 [Frankia sp. Hr75.2]